MPAWIHLPIVILMACGPLLAAAGAYRGGALLVTDPQLHRGHLAPGQVLPVRFSRLAPPDPGEPPLQGSELPGSVRLGRLVFRQLSPYAVTFEADLPPAPPRTVTLRLGERVDLTGDGLPDLALEPPVKALATGAGAIAYAQLAFSCDAGHTAMFLLDPRAFPEGRYPYGISGVTPAGNFIFQSDCLPGRAAAPLAGPGDMLVDTASGRIGRAVQTRKGVVFQADPADPPFLLREVFGAACVQVSGSLADLAQRYRCRPNPARDWQGDLAIDKVLLDDPHARLDLQVAAHLGLHLDLSASVNYYGLSAQMAAGVDETLRLALDFQARQPFSRVFGPYTLAEPKVGFAVCGVPLAVSLKVTAGLDLDDQVTGAALEGLQSQGSWGWSGAMSAGWSWSGVRVKAPDPVSSHALTVQALPENRSTLVGTATVKPWLTLTPRLRFAAVLCGECPNQFSVAGTVAAADGAVRTQEEAAYRLSAGFVLDLPGLGPIWERTWPLYQWSDTVWSQ